MMIDLPESHVRLLAAVLESAAELYSNHGCNDLPDEWEAMLTASEWRAMAVVLSGEDEDDAYVGDDSVLQYFADVFANALASKES